MASLLHSWVPSFQFEAAMWRFWLVWPLWPPSDGWLFNPTLTCSEVFVFILCSVCVCGLELRCVYRGVALQLLWGVTPGITWSHPDFFSALNQPPPCCTSNLCTGLYTVQRVCIHADVHAEVKQQSCGTHSCQVTPFLFFFFLELCLLWDVSDYVHYYYGMPHGVGGGRLHGNTGC